jgi:hypothetical protein
MPLPPVASSPTLARAIVVHLGRPRQPKVGGRTSLRRAIVTVEVDGRENDPRNWPLLGRRREASGQGILVDASAGLVVPVVSVPPGPVVALSGIAAARVPRGATRSVGPLRTASLLVFRPRPMELRQA